MKRIMIAITILFLFAGNARADISLLDTITKLPSNHQCLIYNLEEGTLDYATTFTLAKVWKDKISFDIGYSPSSQLLGAVSIKLVEVKNWIKFPILDLMEIEPMIWVGTDRIENLRNTGEANYGVGVKLLEIKF